MDKRPDITTQRIASQSRPSCAGRRHRRGCRKDGWWRREPRQVRRREQGSEEGDSLLLPQRLPAEPQHLPCATCSLAMFIGSCGCEDTGGIFVYVISSRGMGLRICNMRHGSPQASYPSCPVNKPFAGDDRRGDEEGARAEGNSHEGDHTRGAPAVAGFDQEDELGELQFWSARGQRRQTSNVFGTCYDQMAHIKLGNIRWQCRACAAYCHVTFV